ncbi:DNA polymerase III subunit gamma/tau [Bythopirellula polymerisocia]|uniref:DNA polymerase III subunit gamma/tau n=1 Tax=Bythopirellula polymerisocia TaxID=2528003 RepID=A0A5C6C0V9_9BACT|nr:DNA polymerase III subunit gamma/tau [Bythopirellula polymerisocia]TWU17607.1 DNA polymerase III subunit tau [Bythopirellula polymerisocia]
MTEEDRSTTTGADYVVVARRYRPQGFDELIGQQHVSQALKRAISSDRVGHAYLFTGARGVGKTSAARILAKALNCEQGPTPQPCNECEICQSIAAGDDVDVLEIDGASNRGIDEIRQLRQNVAVRPSRARLKVYIIDEVHMLTKEAFNALLKTLEEPPEHVKFIFATTEANKIPITILSRCQRFDFAGIESTAIQKRLAQIAEAEGVSAEPDALQILAMRAAGSMRDSQSLLEQLLSGGGNTITAADVTEMLGIAPAARLSQLVLPLVNRDAATALSELDAALAEGAEVSQLIDQLLGYFRDVMTQAVGCDESRLLYALPGQRQEVREIAQQLGVHTLLAIVQVLDQTAARMRVSTHARTLAEMAVVRVCQLDNLDELAMLLEQLRESPTNSREAPPAIKKNGPPSQLRSTRPAPIVRDPVSPRTIQAAPEPTTGVAIETASPAPTLALTAENVEQIWKQALDSLNGMVADHASHVDEVAVDAEGRMVITFSESFYRDSCERPSNRSRLESALVEVCGRKVPLMLQAAKRDESASTAPAAPPSRRQQQMELVSQPFVKKAIELFDGDTQRIKYIPPVQ